MALYLISTSKDDVVELFNASFKGCSLLLHIVLYFKNSFGIQTNYADC